jgi:hypothetical protein
MPSVRVSAVTGYWPKPATGIEVPVINFEQPGT